MLSYVIVKVTYILLNRCGGGSQLLDAKPIVKKETETLNHKILDFVSLAGSNCEIITNVVVIIKFSGPKTTSILWPLV